MKRREEKGGEGEVEKKENLVEKLKRVVGKRGGQTTPVQPFWRLHHQLPAAHFSQNGAQDSIFKEEEEIYLNYFPAVSARKLAATLWELDSYNKLPLSKMHQGVSGGGPTSKLRRHHHHHHQLVVKDKGLDLPDPSPSSPDLGSAGGLRRQVAESLMQHHRSIQRNRHAKQPVSPASYGSSMEVAPYNPVATPTSSANFRGGEKGETSYSLKTSAELLKVLNRIWNLEEQHASNVSLVRAMKKELDQARARIRELVRDKQADRHEINELMNQISDDKLARKSKEQDRAVQSVRDELEDERKLRKRSETLHRKLARELYEVKVSLSNAHKDLEKERKSRKMLEELCDEFAWEIKNYEKEIHVLKQKSEKDRSTTNRGDCDTLILRLSESWIDERMQMKEEPEFDLADKQCAVEKLSLEIQNFLEASKNNSNEGFGGVGPRGTVNRRSSLESIPLNVGASAPQGHGDDDGLSESSESPCFELDGPITVDLKPQGDEGQKSQLDSMKKLVSQDKTKDLNPSSLQVKFEEQMAQAISGNEIKNQTVDMEERKAKEENEIIEEIIKEGGFEGRRKAKEVGKVNSDYMDKLKSHYLLSESGTTTLENDYGDSHGNPVWRSHPSPIRQWTTKLPTQDLDISESSSKIPPDIKENTLKSKLLEARTRGQNQRSRLRLKPSKVPF